VTGERAKSVLRKALADATLPMVQMYFMHFVFDAIDAAGLMDEWTFGLMRKWTAIVDEHPTSLKESWTFGDYSHAWGGSPVIQMSARVLGVQAAEAGWAKIRICPSCGDLAWARGVVPTVRGDVAVSWRVDADAFTMEVAVPANVPTENVMCDGRPASIVGESATRVTVAVAGGSHVFVVKNVH